MIHKKFLLVVSVLDSYMNVSALEKVLETVRHHLNVPSLFYEQKSYSFCSGSCLLSRFKLCFATDISTSMSSRSSATNF
ncbi:hypothetical protein EFL25_06715 [Enterococcus faecium]|nr:hypothetical protein [Enterococcus faecium]